MASASGLLVFEDVRVNGAGAHKAAAEGQPPADLLRAMLGLKSRDDLFSGAVGDYRWAS